MQKLKRPVSVILSILMVVSMFAVVPISASAAEETSTVTWNSFSGTGGMSSGGVTLTTQQAKTRVGENFYKGRGSATFTAPEGSVFTKIELKNCTVVDSLNFPGATVAQTGGYWQQEPWDDEPNWVQYYTVTWTGESSEVTFSGAIYGIQSIVFTLKSTAPDYVATVNGTGYETLEDAFAAAVDGDTITLLADCAGNGIKAPQGKFTNGLTVDFAGKTYTVDGETVGSTGTETNGFQLLKDNKITFENGTITSEKAKILVQNYSNLTLEGMTLTLNNPSYAYAYTLSNNNGDVVIDDTTINANPAGGFAFDVCRYSSYPSVNVTVTGDSVINGNVEVSASSNGALNGFSLTLESGTLNGNIVVDKTAAAAMESAPNKTEVTKADTFTQAAPAGYEWVSNGDGTSSLAKNPKLFVGHNLLLGGDIGVNFYLNPVILDSYNGTKTVKFTVDGEETTVKGPFTATDYGYKVTLNVVAARMAHKINAVVYVDGTPLDQTDSYSVQDYAEAVYYDKNKPDELKALAKAMLNYGSEAQTVFATSLTEHPDRADKKVGTTDYTNVTAGAVTAKIIGTASNLKNVAGQLNAEYYTSSLIYLQNNTLRIYFTPKSKQLGGLAGMGFDGALSEYYYYEDKAGIAAAELDEQQTFDVNGVEFQYSALDYVVAVLNSGDKMNDAQKDLAKSLFLYNQAANAYF